MTWSDSPLSIGDQDFYEFTRYARHIARRVEKNHSWSDSTVFGLVGPWGSGKTSILNMIGREIMLPSTPWKVVRFTPWATGDELGMLGEFYSSIYSAIPESERKNFKKTLGKLLEITAPAADSIPIVGKFVNNAATLSGKLLQDDGPWQGQFHQAAEILRKLQIPLLIIADDIDRLEVDELLTFFKIVRLLGRFPGVNYLISYDLNAVFETLSQSAPQHYSAGQAVKYMEKIVQHSFDVPPLTRSQISSSLDSKIQRVLGELGIEIESNANYLSVSDVFTLALNTPRSIERYIQKLYSNLKILDVREVDLSDVLVLTLIQTVAPLLHAALPQYGYELTQGHGKELEYHGGEMGYQEFNLDNLLAKADEDSRSSVRKLTEHLFPALKGRGFNKSQYLGIKRISNPSYFYRYFSMGVLSHDVSDVRISEAFYQTLAGDYRALRKLLSSESQDFVSSSLEKLEFLVNQITSMDGAESKFLNLIECLIEMLSAMDKTRKIFGSQFDDLERIIIYVLSSISSHEGRQAAYTNLKNETDLGQMVRFIQRGNWLKERNLDLYNFFSMELINQVENAVIQHLLAGDEAPIDTSIIRFIIFLDNLGEITNIRKKLTELVATDRMRISTLASRCVSTSVILGVPEAMPQIQDFNQHLFDLIAPLVDDQIYSQSLLEIDLSDVSWSNREKFVRGRVERPDSSLKGLRPGD